MVLCTISFQNADDHGPLQLPIFCYSISLLSINYPTLCLFCNPFSKTCYVNSWFPAFSYLQYNILWVLISPRSLPIRQRFQLPLCGCIYLFRCRTIRTNLSTRNKYLNLHYLFDFDVQNRNCSNKTKIFTLMSLILTECSVLVVLCQNKVNLEK